VRKLDPRLRSLAVVELQQTAEPITTRDLPCSDPRCCWRDELVAQTLVRPFFVIMVDKFSDGRPEMPFAEEHHAIQALGLGGLDKPFGERVQIGTPRGQDQWRDAAVPQEAPKGRRVERISVQDDVLHAAEEAIAAVGEISSDLRHPDLVRFTCNSSDLHCSRLKLDHEEDDVADEAAQRQDFDSEEVRCRQTIPMRGEEGLPGRLRAALRCGLDAVVLEDRFDRERLELPILAPNPGLGNVAQRRTSDLR
jgi:hypothetical protein